MGTIIAAVDMSLDGYYDRMDEWFDPENVARRRISEQLIWAADAALIGRKTYEGLAEFWPGQHDAFADRVNAMPKYVASRTLTGVLDWNAAVLDGPLEEAVPALLQRHRLLVSWGFGELATTLIQLGLLDELQVGIHPFVVGGGAQPFAASAFRLTTIDVRVLDGGAIMASYRPGSTTGE
jgi:dihydrofolate reductase